MRIPLVDLQAQYRAIKPEIDAAIQRVMDNTSFILGKEVAQFETIFSDYMHVKHTIGVSNGTEALYLAMLALGIQSGDEIITTPHTFIATVEPIVQLGAKPVFVDIDPVTYNIDPKNIEAAITQRTKAIVPVHLYGQPANMPAIKAIADKHNLHIIEDAAQAHGAEYAGQRVGHWGAMTGFSFYPGKNLGAAGDAGAIITNNDSFAQQLKLLRDHGSPTKYEHTIIGYNGRIDALQAAILHLKMAHIEKWTEARRQHAAYYNDILAEIPGIITPVADSRARHVYHLYVVRVPGDRQAWFDYLRANEVEVGIHYPIPLHLQPALGFLGHKAGDFPITEAVASSIISLPLYAELTEAQMNRVAELIHQYIHEAVRG